MVYEYKILRVDPMGIMGNLMSTQPPNPHRFDYCIRILQYLEPGSRDRF